MEINSEKIILGGCEGIVNSAALPTPMFPHWKCVKCKQQIWKIPIRKKRKELSRINE